MSPNIISVGELLVEIIRTNLNTPHGVVGANYRGPFPSGAPAIFIDTASRMGKTFNLSTGFIGVIGKDEFGDCIIKKFKNDRVDITQIKITNSKTTGIAFNQYNSDGSRTFIFSPGAAEMTNPSDIKAFYFEDIKNLHIMGSALSISKSSCEACEKAIKIAKRNNPNVVISFDPNLRPEMLKLNSIPKVCKKVLEKTEILLPSGNEAELLARTRDSTKACQKLLNYGPKVVVLKEGKDGCTVFTRENINGIKVNGFNVNEVDPTGAGDSFGAAFLIGYLMGWDLVKTARFANGVGALKVQNFGPMPDTSYEQVIKFIENQSSK